MKITIELSPPEITELKEEIASQGYEAYDVRQVLEDILHGKIDDDVVQEQLEKIAAKLINEVSA